MTFSLLAAALTFTATATGVEKGTPVEFAFAGKNSDRDYETMFLLDEPVDDFCSRLERAGLPRGRPTDAWSCRLWPVGCKLSFNPPLGKYIEGKMPEGLPEADPIYTGGTRLPNGLCDAGTNMPLSVFSIFSLAQSPIVYDGDFNQGLVYGAFKAKDTLKKGERISFTVSWDERSLPRALHLTAKPGKGGDLIRTLRGESEKGSLDVLLGFDDDMTIAEATGIATAIASIDSPRVRINGCTNVFYRTFLPLVKWRDRKERLVQPFELTIGNPVDKLVFIEEDWTVEGDDPKLTPREIQFSDAIKYERTDTCLIYADGSQTISRLVRAMRQFGQKKIRNWYVFAL